MTKPSRNIFDIWKHSPFRLCSCHCLHPMRWFICCYLDQYKNRGCSVALNRRWLIYLDLSFYTSLARTLSLWHLRWRNLIQSYQGSASNPVCLTTWPSSRQRLCTAPSTWWPGCGTPSSCSPPPAQVTFLSHFTHHCHVFSVHSSCLVQLRRITLQCVPCLCHCVL